MYDKLLVITKFLHNAAVEIWISTSQAAYF